MCTFVGTYIALTVSTFYHMGLTPCLLNQKPRYSVYVCPNNYFSLFTFTPASTSICRTLYNAFILSLKLFIVFTSKSSMYASTISNPLNSLDIYFVENVGTVVDPYR